MKRKIQSEYDIKNDADLDFDDIKREKKKKQKKCPECDNAANRKVIGKFMFCGACHRMIGRAPMQTDETPIKECFNGK